MTNPSQITRRGGRTSILLICLALAGALSVFLANGRGLFYYDTGGYLDAGDGALAALGWDNKPDPAAAPSPASVKEALNPKAVRTGDGARASPDADNRTVGSRSALYGIVLSLAQSAGWLDAVVVLNIAVLGLSVWLLSRVVVRAWHIGQPPMLVAASLLLAGCAGSLPFYTAFLMPDILAPVLILMIAVLATFFRDMHRWEILIAALVAAASVLAHPSHLVIAVLLTVIAVLFAGRHRVRLVLVLVGLVVGIGILERVAFTEVVELTQKSKVFYLPFLTARLIDDGAGMDYLSTHCPDAELASCELFDKIVRHEPQSLGYDAPMILFSKDPRYGSYRLLPVEVQTRISAEQIGFALNVFADRPIAVITGILKNTAEQLRLSGIDMVVPTPEIVDMLVTQTGRLAPTYAQGRLIAADRGWIEAVEQVHRVVYLVSMIGILGLLVWKRDPGAKLAAIILSGIVVNAFVCGAISEPADRYGARVMFLLPLLLALLLWAPTAKNTGRER